MDVWIDGGFDLPGGMVCLKDCAQEETMTYCFEQFVFHNFSECDF